MDLKLLLCKIKIKFFPRYLRKGDFNYILEKQGISIGKGTVFFAPETMQIDRSRPYLLKIGEYCKITAGTTILTHDYSRSVLRRVYGDVIGDGAETVIGNNVFIGMHSIILMGSHIGNNVIVGAGSVVSGRIPDNVVVAGNPARVIRTLDGHYDRWKKRELSAACECFKNFYERYKRYPTEKEMDPFYFLYLERNLDKLFSSGVNIDLSGDEREDIIEKFMNSIPMFNGFDEFAKYCCDNMGDRY